MVSAATAREIRKVVRPGTVPTYGGGRMSVFVEIGYRDGRLSLSGVEGPNRSGNATGGCGQIDMGYAHRDPADDDTRYDAPTPARAFNFAPGWDRATWLELLDVWKRWHLNDMRAGCEHQRALGWKYDTHRDPDQEAPGYPHVGLPCPECGYRIGSAWLREEVPAEVLDFLEGLPETDRPYPWRMLP
jgi:hypothetical protein